MKNTDYAIRAQNISKHFRLPHEQIKTLRSAFVNVFQRKTYEEFYALKDVSFDVKKGEFFSVIGRNGSGKSTLLSVLAQIYTPDSGTLEVNGEISPFLALGIGFNPELSGRDNIFLNATVLGLSQELIQEKFDDIVAFAELERFIDAKVGNYSSGMRSRLAFSVAIHADKDIFLMDEVLAVGDERFKAKCHDVFRKFIDEGKTIIFVAHSMQAIERYSDRVMILHEGENKGIFDNPKEGIKTYNEIINAN